MNNQNEANVHNNEYLHSSYSMRKIPVERNEDILDSEDNKYLDKIKILELSNVIDEWEREILFSSSGFYTLKGKDVENKAKEFIKELDNLINSKISTIKFSTINAKEAAEEIKKLKITNIERQMLNHEAKELFEWEIDVYEKTMDSSLQKAVLYKNNPEVISLCLKNALSVLKLMSEREKWNNKIYKSRKEKYLSDFYYALIKSFLDEKNINFSIYLDKYKEFLSEDKVEEIEKISKEIKNNIIAFNWAKELFSYNLDNNENEKEIRALKDSELENLVRKYFDILISNKKNQEKILKDENINKCWENIISFLETEPEKAILYVDINQPKEIVSVQKEYIKKMVKDGSIKTDKSKYIDLFKEMLKDFSGFQKKCLSEYKSSLSKEDYDFFSNIQNKEYKDFIIFRSDYDFLFKEFETSKIKSPEMQYELIVLFNNLLEQYKTINSKDADIEKKNKIIEIILERNSRKEKSKEKDKKELEEDDSIIDKTGK